MSLCLFVLDQDLAFLWGHCLPFSCWCESWSSSRPPTHSTGFSSILQSPSFFEACCRARYLPFILPQPPTPSLTTPPPLLETASKRCSNANNPAPAVCSSSDPPHCPHPSTSCSTPVSTQPRFHVSALTIPWKDPSFSSTDLAWVKLQSGSTQLFLFHQERWREKFTLLCGLRTSKITTTDVTLALDAKWSSISLPQ